MCRDLQREPLITVERVGEEAVKYANVTPEKARQIFHDHIIGGHIVCDATFARGWEQPERAFDGQPSDGVAVVPSIKNVPFFGMQQLWVMKNRGLINAEVIDEYIANDGYFGAAKALFQLSPQRYNSGDQNIWAARSRRRRFSPQA